MEPLGAAPGGPETPLDDDGAVVRLWRGWAPPARVAALEAAFADAEWEQRWIRGRPAPRLNATYGAAGLVHRYSGTATAAAPWEDAPADRAAGAARELAREISPLAGAELNLCLANLYRDGDDRISAHSDAGGGPVASLSLGARRAFVLRRKRQPGRVVRLELGPGDLCLMLGRCQELYTHEVPRQAGAGSRVSLTFRALQ